MAKPMVIEMAMVDLVGAQQSSTSRWMMERAPSRRRRAAIRGGLTTAGECFLRRLSCAACPHDKTDCLSFRRTSPASTRPRASLSSSDEQRSNLSIEPTQNGTLRDGSFPFPSSSLSQLTTVPQRRQTISRPGLHSAAPSISVERPTISTDRPSAVLDVDTDSPVSLGPSPLSNGIEQHQSYPRARRKSLSHSTATALLTKLDDEPLLNGSPHGKGKKKRFRAASFSLPTHRRRRLSNASYWRWWSRKVPRPVKQWFLVLLIPLALIYGIFLWRRKYELQIEFSVFSHKWIRREVDLIQPLRGCFDPHNVSPEYNISLHTGPKRQLLTPGVAIRRGMSCYDFASTVQSFHDVPLEPLTYHTYWRSDLIPFGERHTATLLSFLATQPLSQSKLVLWSNGADLVANNYFVRPFLEKWGDNIEVRQVDMNALTRGTELDGLLSGIDGGGLFDERAWVDGDAVRLLVLWHFGGVWLDMDQVLTRDLHPLTESEFVTQWDCYGESSSPSGFNLSPPSAACFPLLVGRARSPSAHFHSLLSFPMLFSPLLALALAPHLP